MYFFFSSRRRHTRFKCDWSSDVCSSDLPRAEALLRSVGLLAPSRSSARSTVQMVAPSSVTAAQANRIYRDCVRSEERREGKSVDLGGRRIIKKKKKKCP